MRKKRWMKKKRKKRWTHTYVLLLRKLWLHLESIRFMHNVNDYIHTDTHKHTGEEWEKEENWEPIVVVILIYTTSTSCALVRERESSKQQTAEAAALKRSVETRTYKTSSAMELHACIHCFILTTLRRELEVSKTLSQPLQNVLCCYARVVVEWRRTWRELTNFFNEIDFYSVLNREG